MGKAIRESGVHREAVFVTSKVPGGLDGPATAAAVTTSLDELEMSTVDLMLIHYPANWDGSGGQNRVAAWRALEAAVRSNQTRAIGVSHFCPRHVLEILKAATLPIAVNQVEYHLGMANSSATLTDGKQFDKQHNITYESFMPLCGQCNDNELISGPVTTRIGEKYNKTGAQIALRWLVQQGIPVIPRSGNSEHLIENLSIFDFELSSGDMNELHDYTNKKIGGEGGDCDVA